MAPLEETLSALARDYSELHSQKEDLFWSTKMGLTEDVAEERMRFRDAQQAWDAFLQDPSRLVQLRD